MCGFEIMFERFRLDGEEFSIAVAVCKLFEFLSGDFPDDVDYHISGVFVKDSFGVGDAVLFERLIDGVLEFGGGADV